MAGSGYSVCPAFPAGILTCFQALYISFLKALSSRIAGRFNRHFFFLSLYLPLPALQSPVFSSVSIPSLLKYPVFKSPAERQNVSRLSSNSSGRIR